MSIPEAVMMSRLIRRAPPLKAPWAQLPNPTSGIAGMQVWCTDYPSPSGLGAMLICTGARWRPDKGSHPLFAFVAPTIAGVNFAAGSGTSLIAPEIKIPAGAIKPGDQFRLSFTATNPVADTNNHGIRIQASATQGGVLAATWELDCYVASFSSTTTQWDVDKRSIVVTNTDLSQGRGGLVSAAIVASPLEDLTGQPTFASDRYIAPVVLCSAGSSFTLKGLRYDVEYGS